MTLHWAKLFAVWCFLFAAGFGWNMGQAVSAELRRRYRHWQMERMRKRLVRELDRILERARAK